MTNYAFTDSPITVDRLTARALETIAPSRLEEIKNSIHNFRKYAPSNSKIIKLDKTQIGHKQVNEIKIKITKVKVETYISMDGITIRNGRQIFYKTKLPQTVIESLKKIPANKVIETDILKDHIISYANNEELRLKEENWIPIGSIIASGCEAAKITMPDFLNAIENLGITYIDYAGFNYISRLNKDLHIVLARIEDAINQKNTKKFDIADLNEYAKNEIVNLYITGNKIHFSLETCSFDYDSGNVFSYTGQKLSTKGKYARDRYFFHLEKPSSEANLKKYIILKTDLPYRPVKYLKDLIQRRLY